MNNTENSVAQLLLDHQLLSAYRNGVMNAQLRSLYPSIGLSSLAGDIVSPQLLDHGLLQALIPATTPQDQLATQIALLNNALRTTSNPLVAPSSIPNVTVDDLLLTLGDNGLGSALSLSNYHSSILSPPASSLIHDGQGLLGSLLSGGFDTFRPSSNFDILNPITMNMLDERNSRNIMKVLNAMSATSVSVPSLNSNNSMNADVYDLIRKRQAESFLLSEQAKKARNEDTTHRTETIPRRYAECEESLCSSNHSTKHYKRNISKSIMKGTKDMVREANMSATYEDAQLLFDSFVTLASGGKNMTKGSSIVSVDESEASTLEYEDFGSNSELTSKEFWDKVPHALTISMAQMSLARMKPVGKFVDMCDTGELGHAAMCCKHCKCVIGFGSHFFKSLRQGSHIHRLIKHVQSDCTACPNKIQTALQKHCAPITSSSLGLTMSDSSKSKEFFDYVWIQLCTAGFVDDKANDDAVGQGILDHVDCSIASREMQSLDVENDASSMEDESSEE